MNILHLDEQTGWRGGEQQASWLIQGSAAKGHQIWIAGRPGSRFLHGEHGGAALTRIALPFRFEADLHTAWKLAQVIYDNEIEVIHAHTSHAHAIACLARKFAQRGAVVVSRRVSFPPKQDPINRLKYAAPDVFIAVSEKVAEVLLESGVAPEKVRCVHSAVDLARLDVPPLERAELGVQDGVPLILSAGALVGHKDHATLVSAIAILREKFPEIHVLIAGEGELREPLEAQIAQLSLGKTITLLGHREDVPRLMRTADCYVSSSWSEGLGTSVLEALACETPVVAAVAGGIPEMVLPGKTGYLVPNRDPEALAGALADALEHPREAARMAVAGRKLVERAFTVDAMVEGTLAIYLETVAQVKGFTS